MPVTILRNARVFDGVSDHLIEDADVVIEGKRIRELSHGRARTRADIEIDLGRRTLLPGLIDAHVHVFAVNLVATRNEAMPLTLMTAMATPRIKAMLDRGFTSVRDVGGGDVGIRDAVAQGFIPGPRLFVGGPGFTQTGGHADHRKRTDARAAHEVDRNSSAFVFQNRLVDGADEMRIAARDELRKGADHIKLMMSGGVGSPSDHIEDVQFNAEEVRIAVEEANRKRKYVCAHAYPIAAIRHALENGVRTIEHANFIDEATAAFARQHNAFIVPTLVCYAETAKHGDRLGLSAFVMEKLAVVNVAGIAMLEPCRRSGVKMGFGTDLMGELEYAQSHEFVIRSRVENPFDVLRSATSVNAEILNRSGDLGVIASGALADIVVVDGDPTRDMTLLDGQGEHIPVIIQDGRIYRNRLT